MIFVDTEWGFRDGRVNWESAFEPVVFCAVDSGTGEEFTFWRRDPQLVSWLREHGSHVFAAHYAVAEMQYLLRLGLPLPPNWYCTYTAYRWLTNRPETHSEPIRAGLSEALHALGRPRMAPEIKKDLQQKILHLNFDWDNEADRDEIRAYCLSDCHGCRELYQAIQDRVPVTHMRHWTEFLKVTARVQQRGLRVDLPSYDRIQSRWPEIRQSLMDEINQTAPVYVDGVEKRGAFFRWAGGAGVDWPTKKSPATGERYCPLDDDTLKDMEVRHPFIARYRQTRKTLRAMNKRSMTLDRTAGRHYFDSVAFRSTSGRSQMKGSLFIGPKWLRFLAVPDSPDHVLVSADYTAQEIGIAAGLSGDETMTKMYQGRDAHVEFAKLAGACPPSATKGSHPDIRKVYKTISLGALYGQTAYGMARRLGVTKEHAQELVSKHRRLFSKFWMWSDRVVDLALDRGWVITPCGWRATVPSDSNDRTWMNFPMQAGGADIMRATAIYLDQQGVQLLALIHDGFLMSCRRDQLTDVREAIDHACKLAVDHVVPGFPMRWDVDVHEGRYFDKDGWPMWEQLQRLVGVPAICPIQELSGVR